MNDKLKKRKDILQRNKKSIKPSLKGIEPLISHIYQQRQRGLMMAGREGPPNQCAKFKEKGE